MDPFLNINVGGLTSYQRPCLFMCLTLACLLQMGGQFAGQFSGRLNGQETTTENTEWRTPSCLAIEALREKFATEMRSLADKARQLNLPAEAKIAEAQIVRFYDDRQTIFMPSGMILSPQANQQTTESSTTEQSKNQQNFHRRLKKVKQAYAADLFALVPKCVADRQAAAAYQLLHEVLVYDPQHAEARRILGFRKHDNYGWIRSAKTTRVSKGRTDRKLIGWKKGSYSMIISPHFKIYSAPGDEAGLKLAAELERTYWVWRQVFFEYQSGTRQVSEWLNTKRSDPFSSRQYEVYLFRDRQQYNRDLAVVPGIEQSTGYYDEKAKASFFYLDEDVELATWRHETVHQLLQENAGSPIKGEQEAHAWLVEGVALYFETMKVYQNHVTLGGWEADRLQYARRRCKREGFFLPMTTFDAITREDLQARSDKGRVYSQAAGIAQFLMSAQQGRYRDSFIQFVREFYRVRKMKKGLAEQTLPLDQMDRQYQAYLSVGAGKIQTTLADAGYDKTQLKVLSIGRSGLTDDDMPLLKECRQLDWLELSQNKITDAGLSNLFGQIEKAGPNQLSELYLDVTAITDESAKILGSLQTLQVLDLASTRIGDASVKQIAELPRMQILYMANTQVTDASVEDLMKMPNLRLLDLRQTKVTAEAVQRLKTKNPELDVMR